MLIKQQSKSIRSRQIRTISQLVLLLAMVNVTSLSAVDRKSTDSWSTQWSSANSSGLSAYGNLFQAATGETYVVHCHYQSSSAFREIIKKAGAKIISDIPKETFIIESDQKTVDLISGLSMVRWVEAFEPSYKLTPPLLDKLKSRNLSGIRLQNRYLLSLYQKDETSLKEMGRFLEKITGQFHHFNGKDFEVSLGDRELFKLISHHNVQFIDEWPSGAIALSERKPILRTP